VGGEVIVVTAPFRAVLNANYKIEIGDTISVIAFQSAQDEDMFVAAELNNGGKILTLRDASGVPAAGPGRGNGYGGAGRGNGNCGNCPNR
jgi:hypothetical protein